MILQFDLGNSSIKWRILEQGQPGANGRFAHHEVLPRELFSEAAADCEIQVSSVANPAVTNSFLGRLEASGDRRIVVAESQPQQLGLTNAYDDPSKMGVDRWLAMLGAWHGSREALLVVDAGSALTVDIVGHDGQHEGGFIIPGRQLMRDSLQRGTSRVLFEATEDPVPEPGRDTQACVSRGLSWLWRGLVAQIHHTAEVRGIEAIWLTGGDASHLCESGLKARYVRDLVLDGLALYCENPPGVDR